jgi:hypothetical protein
MELPQVPNPDPTPTPRCIHLLSKAMAVHGEGFDYDPEYHDMQTDFTCLKTGRPLGPDNNTCGIKRCSNADRDCYEEY